MIAMILLGMAAMLFTFSIIMMLVGEQARENSLFVGIGLALVFLFNLIVCGLLILSALGPVASLSGTGL